MQDKRIEYSLSWIAGVVGGAIAGDGDIVLEGVASLASASVRDISFLANRKYLPMLAKSHAGAVICPEDLEISGRNLLRVRDPYLAFGQAVSLFHPPAEPSAPGVHPTALLGEDVEFGKSVSIGPYSIIGDRSSLSDNVVVGPLVYLGEGVEIGENTVLGPRVTVYNGVRIGRRCLIQSGTVLGGDGFGFAREATGRYRKIPQVGGLVIEDDVETGSNCAVDRGSLDDTIIARGTKLDNLVHVAHNVTVGEDSLLIAQVGISGSTHVGKNVVLAGQSGLVGHLEIGDGAVVGAQAGVTRSVKAGEVVSGYPARPHKYALKTQASLVKIPAIVKKLTALEEKIEKLVKNGADSVPEDEERSL